MSTAWTAVVNLIQLAVVLAMFQVAKSPFETLVVAGLVLTYCAVLSTLVVIGTALSKRWEQDTERFIMLAKAVRLDTELHEQALAESREESESATINLGITSAFRYLPGLIATLYVLYVVWQHFA
jgi:hypothetical protein